MILKKSFYARLFLAGFLTFILHEAAHWLVGAAFGFDMQPRLNAVRILSPTIGWQKALSDIAGPAVTALQAIIALCFIRRANWLDNRSARKSHTAFAFLYFAAFMRFVAAFLTPWNPNDEARVSVFLGLNMWVLPLLVGSALVVLAWIGSRRLKLTWKDQVLCYVVTSVTTALIVGIDRYAF